MVVRPYIVTAVLLALLLALQAQLWFGRGSMPAVDQLKARLEQLEHDNAAARLANEQLASEVSDLQEGLEVIEAYARQELGMVKANEIFVQYTQSRRCSCTLSHTTLCCCAKMCSCATKEVLPVLSAPTTATVSMGAGGLAYKRRLSGRQSGFRR